MAPDCAPSCWVEGLTLGWRGAAAPAAGRAEARCCPASEVAAALAGAGDGAPARAALIEDAVLSPSLVVAGSMPPGADLAGPASSLLLIRLAPRASPRQHGGAVQSSRRLRRVCVRPSRSKFPRTNVLPSSRQPSRGDTKLRRYCSCCGRRRMPFGLTRFTPYLARHGTRCLRQNLVVLTIAHTKI